VIVGSLLLILVAVTLLVLGLASGSSGLLISSIAASLLAAVALVVGTRQATAARGGVDFTDDARFSDDELNPRAGEGEGKPRRRRPPTNTRMAGSMRDDAADPFGNAGPVLTDPVEVTVPAQGARRRGPSDDTGWRQPTGASAASGFGPASGGESGGDAVPADEPAVQQVAAADAARVARLAADVHVVDGRPRYHLPDCVHLRGRESERLPVGEAVESGFTPCARCEPDTALLADARRR